MRMVVLVILVVVRMGMIVRMSPLVIVRMRVVVIMIMLFLAGLRHGIRPFLIWPDADAGASESR